MAERETISKLRAVATLKSQSEKNDKRSEQRSWWPIMTPSSNDESELIKVTLPNPALTGQENNR